MTTVIETVEQAILAAAESALANTVQVKETLPGGWTLDMMKRALQFAPGVYVTWHGGQPSNSPKYLNARFSLYVVTKGATDQVRRSGGPMVIGAYDMVERLIPVVDRLQVESIGHLKLRGVENLFRDALFNLGGTVYGIQLEMPNMPFNSKFDISTLADFETYAADHLVGDGPVASDQLNLPQE